jgi:hypothetical protein
MREIAWKTNNKFVNLEPEMQRYASLEVKHPCGVQAVTSKPLAFQ